MFLNQLNTGYEYIQYDIDLIVTVDLCIHYFEVI